MAKHSIELAEFVIEAKVLPEALYYMGHQNENIAIAAATLIKEVCKHSLEVRQFICFILKINFT